MRAVVLRKTGGPEELHAEELSVPEPSSGDVLVRVRAAAVCGRDLIDRRGGFPLMKLPTVLGHEFAGEVVSAPKESEFKPGDRVLNLHRPRCGSCARCLGGEPILCERAWQSFGHTVDGGYAEYVVAHPLALMKLPNEISFEVGATLMCTAGVALQALREKGRLQLGETVLITGASGGVGVMAVQLARRMGARVIAVTSSPAKVEALEALGANHVIVNSDGRFHQKAQHLSDGGVDLSLEVTGSATFDSALRSLRRGGRIVVVGNIETSKIAINPGALILYGYTIVGSASCTHQDLKDVLGLTAAGELKPQIAKTLPLSEAAEAHRLLEARAVVGRIVLVP